MTALAVLVEALHAEARRTNERRLLVLHGAREACYERAREALAVADVDPRRTTLVGERDVLPAERVPPKRTTTLLGTTTDVAVVDAHDTFRPNALGRVVGTVDGGGLCFLLAPPLHAWSDRRNGFDASLAVFPYDTEDVSGAFRTRLVDLLRAHPGIAIVDADSGCVEREGLTDPAPRLPSRSKDANRFPGESGPTSEEAGARDARRERDERRGNGFPSAVYERCLTSDQARCVGAFERLGGSDVAIVAEADRGRGKSSAAGLAAGALAASGKNVFVTAPSYRASAEIFARAGELLSALDVSVTCDEEENPRVLDAESGCVRFLAPAAAADLLAGRTEDAIDRQTRWTGIETETRGDTDSGNPDVVFVDEAAGLPVSLLDRLLAADRIAFATTVHGYEGAGRGFSVRFRDRLTASDHEVFDVRLDDPIRYAAGDPLEVWVFRALSLDARPPVDALVDDAAPETVRYERLGTAELLADEHLLREAFGLLVAAHYRTEPNDLARLLDAPNLSVRALRHRGHVVSVCLLAREGSLSAGRRRDLSEGGRIKGHMIPDVLTSQLRDEDAGAPSGVRVVRIATHEAVRSRGFGSHLLDELRTELEAERNTGSESGRNGENGDHEGIGPVDWLGVGYGATPPLIDFWRRNGFRTVHVSTTRNETSGEHSLVMLAPLTERGRDLTDRHTNWFARRFPAVLSDALSDLDPDVARGALRGARIAVEPSLSERDWRVVRGAALGSGLYDADPRPFRRLALAYFTDSGSKDLSDREERLLVRRVFQAQSPEQVATVLGYESRRQCLRALGDAYAMLVERYGGEAA